MDQLAHNVKKSGLGEMTENNIGGGGASPPQSYFSFVAWPATATVFPISQETVTVKYEVDSDVLLNYLVWEILHDDKLSNVANATFEQTNKNSNEVKAEDPLELVQSGSNSAAVLDLQKYGEKHPGDSSPMRFLMSWQVDGEIWGTTTSEFFAIVDVDADSEVVGSKVSSANSATPTTQIISSATATTSASADGEPDIARTSVSSSESTSESTSKPTNSSGGGGGGGGLGTGAIAGIAVGAIIGVLLVGALAWFILRKRRQNKKLAEGYTATDSGNTYMVDKETHGRTADSPNSPYSDENGVQHIPGDNTAREDPSTTERGLPRTSTSGSQGGRSASGAQTPQGVSANVAHLVEDGMTADEIRRLEEEERQLDDEIERAARR